MRSPSSSTIVPHPTAADAAHRRHVLGHGRNFYQPAATGPDAVRGRSVGRATLGAISLIVDGNNVIGARPDGWWRDRPGAVRRLLARCSASASRSLLVLDVPQPDLPEGDHGVVTVRYATRRGRDAADDRIRELVVAGATSSRRTGRCATTSRRPAPRSSAPARSWPASTRPAADGPPRSWPVAGPTETAVTRYRPGMAIDNLADILREHAAEQARAHRAGARRAAARRGPSCTSGRAGWPPGSRRPASGRRTASRSSTRTASSTSRCSSAPPSPTPCASTSTGAWPRRRSSSSSTTPRPRCSSSAPTSCRCSTPSPTR